ncbi:MAG: DNA-3-methyladenine glycosylase I [Candidatus Muirbacterium halophilum]|nr:DNA-3-methyladenine glycosylase I [Candidatus Muirbacterium halophilum]MCK9477220.1 DNA-3-methyladenine glycosylase I [Candidatus Muirbacterium halophilum]
MAVLCDDGKKRCFGYKKGQKIYADYHDNEWGIPVFDDKKLFEMLVLEGAQAGLSWETVLKKRDGYRRVFFYFDVKKVCKMTDSELEMILKDKSIIRNRRKVFSARNNACVFIKIQNEFKSFSNYLWNFVDNKPIKNNWNFSENVPVKTELSDKISKDLKKRGMSFVGSTIIYSYMQAIGMVNDHTKDCCCYNRD